jgi:hypothetical protein
MKIIILSLLLSSQSLFAAQDIFDKMDKETAITTGIYKLSTKERAELMAWLDGSRKQIAKEEKKKNMGFEQKDGDREVIHSSVEGEFNGWQGKTVFKLANGQVWKQVEKTIFYIPKRSNPDVTIKPKLLGSWTLFLDGYSRGVKVRRVK